MHANTARVLGFPGPGRRGQAGSRPPSSPWQAPRSASGLDSHLAFLRDHRAMGAGLAGEGSELHEPFSQDHSLDWEWSATLRPGFSSGFPGTSGPGGLRSSPVHPLPGVGSENNSFCVSCHFSTFVSVPSARYTLEFCYQLCHLVALSSVLMVFKSQ